ncbi:hypothetical protein PPL_03746 [Heterostelium album PN500]|uniref:Flavin-containing monooxygenase n=1 Tax=Heterostelium pallidum (strain ATCC 26659 / Pp 5 / PN500) TaxID=670386 RepID=D3B6J8_HETP5|nr:hypothetical protein PPL_03746 [Heterostelium album PN500]EFA82968.1 hypothetical protein PPL_03746 [Heterostelium album PN500]|eukprot:XP_020435085.1 hypothetical protein PPL_03746 [Heterostelium album PN500]
MNPNRTVAIIGGGPAGLVSCKSALEAGMLPTLFEKNRDIGGVWSKSSGFVWDSLRVNFAVYAMVFSDFPWEADWHTGNYPPHVQLSQYLERYANHFNLMKHIKFNSTVTRVYQAPGSQRWTVQYNQDQSETFDCVIVASGKFNNPRTPNIPGIESFTGTYIHSREYKNRQQFRGQSFLVVGDNHSGAEISADLAGNHDDVSVTQLMKRPKWIIKREQPRYLLDPTKEPAVEEEEAPSKETVPYEFILYCRKSIDYDNEKYKSPEERFIHKNEWLSKLCSKQQTNENLRKQLPIQDTPSYTISDVYTDLVLKGRITIERSEVIRIDGKTIHFSKGEPKQFDHIIFANGYSYEISFLDKDLLEDLHYDPSNRLIPIALHKSVFPPTKWQNIAFVGWYVGALFPVTELQSRWVSQVLSQQMSPPTSEQINAGILDELAIRKNRFNLRLPHANMVVMADKIASQFGVLPDFERIKREDPDLYKLIYNNFSSPAIYRLSGPYSKPELAKQILSNINKQFYDI